MRPESRAFVWDACQAADRVARFVAGKTLENYIADELLRSAVERQLEIVGEALAAFRRSDPDDAVAIPDLPRAVALRNILIHRYATVNDRIVWGIVAVDLPTLRTILRRLLEGA